METKTTKKMTLAAFAAEKAQRLSAAGKVASLPKHLREQVDEGIKEGLSNPTIADWLGTMGVKISHEAIRTYRRKRAD